MRPALPPGSHLLDRLPWEPRAGRYDRHVRAFGAQGQRALRRLTVAVVGLGGTGSLVVQALAHLGAGRLLLIDDDRVDRTSLNRLVGATPRHAHEGTAKVEVARQLVQRANPDVRVAAVRASVCDAATWGSLRAADVLVGAVDAHAPRWALNRFAVQYGHHYVDMGVEISREQGALSVAGHVACVAPAKPCLCCMQGYDPAAVARELQPELRHLAAASGYLTDAPDEAAPSVIFLNQVVAAVAVGELLNIVAPWKEPSPYTLIDLGQPSMTSIDAYRDPACPVCGRDGVAGRGDLAGVPAFHQGSGDPLPDVRRDSDTVASATLSPRWSNKDGWGRLARLRRRRGGPATRRTAAVSVRAVLSRSRAVFRNLSAGAIGGRLRKSATMALTSRNAGRPRS